MTKTGYVRPLQPHAPEKLQTLEAVAVPPSGIVDITPFKLPQNIFFQQQEPSCVAHLVTWLIMVAWWKQTGNVVRLSPRFIYALCKTVDGLPATDGTYLETAFNIAKEYGVCEDSYFPNDCTLDVATYTNAALITQAAKDNALKYKIEDFAFLADLSVAGLEAAIARHGVIGIGTDVSSHWWTNAAGQNSWAATDLLPLRPLDATHPEVSGHAVALYAWGEPWDATFPTNLWGMNWWSDAWSYNGRFCYGADYEPTVYEAAYLWLPTTPESAPNVAVASVVPEPETNPSPLEVFMEDVEKVVDALESVL